MGFQWICTNFPVVWQFTFSRGTDPNMPRQQVALPSCTQVVLDLPPSPRTSSTVPSRQKDRFPSLDPDLQVRLCILTRPPGDWPSPEGQKHPPWSPQESGLSGMPGQGAGWPAGKRGPSSPRACCRWCRAWWPTAPWSGGTSWSSRHSAS